MCCSSSRTNRGIDQRPVDEPGFDDLGDPAVDDRARVDDDVWTPSTAGALGGPVGGRGRPPPPRAAGPGAWPRSGRASRAQGRSRRRAAATARTAREAAEREPEQEAHQQADEEPGDGGDELGRGQLLDSRMSQRRGDDRQVRQHANPRTPQATTHSATSAPRRRSPGKARAGGRQDEADGPAEQGAKDTDVADQRFPRGLARRPVTGDGSHGAVSLASWRRPRHVPARPSASACRDRIARACRRARRPSGDLRGAGPAAGRGTIARRKPEPSRFTKPPLEAGHRTQLPEEADLADGDGPGHERPVAERRRERQRDRQVETRLADGQAAGEVGVHVVAPADPGPPAEHGHEQAQPVRVDAAGPPDGAPKPAGGRAPGPRRGAAGCLRASGRRRCRAPGRRARRGTRAPGRRPRPDRCSRHLEDADLVGGPEPVLRRAQEPERREPLALEVEHGVDEVLERLRAGDRPVLRDVTGQDDGGRRRPSRRPSGGASPRGPGRRCRPVPRARPRSRSGSESMTRTSGRSAAAIRGPPRCRARRRPGRGTRRAVEEPEPAGPQVDLAGRLLARGIERAGRRPPRQRRGEPSAAQGGLADPRFTADQDDRILTRPPPSTRSSSPIPTATRGCCRSARSTSSGTGRRDLGRAKTPRVRM